MAGSDVGQTGRLSFGITPSGFPPDTKSQSFLLVAAGLVLVVIGAGAAALWFGRLP